MMRSIRFRLTLWYGVWLSLLLIIAGSLLYTTLSTHLVDNLDSILAVQSDGIADAILAFWDGVSVEQRTEALAKVHAAKRRHLPFIAVRRTLHELAKQNALDPLIHQWSEETDDLEEAYPIRVLNASCALLAESASFPDAEFVPLPDCAAITAHADTRALRSDRARVLTWPVVEAGERLYVVQVSANLRQTDDSLDRLRMWLLIFAPGAVVIALSLGWLMAGRALRPVGAMARRAATLSANRLNERLDVPRTHDELQTLAETLNDLLARLERSFRRIRQFSAAASHELRTPLTVLRGELDVALRRERTPEEYRAVLHTQLEAIDDLSDTAELLLSLSRSEATTDAFTWSTVDLCAIAREVVALFASVATQKNLQLSLAEAEFIEVRGEGHLLKRLLANLVENAVRHTPNGGRVELRVWCEHAHAHCAVRDSGPGIPEEQRATLFERFFRAHAADHAPDGNIGLGLGLCRWIAEAHGGRLRVESPEGEGATFILDLPT